MGTSRIGQRSDGQAARKQRDWRGNGSGGHGSGGGGPSGESNAASGGDDWTADAACEVVDGWDTGCRVAGDAVADAGRGQTRGMGRGAKHRSRAGQARPSLYAEVTTRILAELDEGRVPWVQPWDTGHACVGMPRNAASHRAYSGINVLILWSAVIQQGYATQGWLTYGQARSLGGHVRQGERGITVCYADRFCPQAEQERAERAGGDPRSIAFLKRFTVFNVDQCEGLPDGVMLGAEPLPPREIVPVAEVVIENLGADFRVGGDRAFYHPARDFVQVPPQPAFRDQINFYRTVFHELGHWTGHTSRLARDLSGQFGSAAYAREELVAEIASAFVCAELNIRPTVRHSDYIGAWVDLIRADERAIFRAAAQAAKAAQWIMGQRRDAQS